MENVTRNERAQLAEGQAHLDRQDANRKACPIAACLFDTLIEAQCAAKGDQGIVASFIIRVGGRIDDREEVSAEDAEKALRQCGLWPEAQAPVIDITKAVLGQAGEKCDFGGVGFYRIEVNGRSFWIRPADAGPVAYAVIINGVEVARIPAKNDWHAINKARKLFGIDARAVKLLGEVEPVADPFSRIRS